MVSWCLSGFGGLRLSLILLYIKSFMVGTLQMFEMLCLLRSSEMDLGLGLVVGWGMLLRGWGRIFDFWDMLLADKDWLSIEVSGLVYKLTDDS